MMSIYMYTLIQVPNSGTNTFSTTGDSMTTNITSHVYLILIQIQTDRQTDRLETDSSKTLLLFVLEQKSKILTGQPKVTS